MVLRVGSYASLEYWMDRLIANQHHSELLRLDPTSPQSLVFWDPEGHEVELMVSDSTDAPLIADADDIPAEAGWYVLGTASDFTSSTGDTIGAENLGWAPNLIDGGDSGLVAEGDVVDTAIDGGPDGVGLVDQELLAITNDSAGVAEEGSWTANAALTLKTPTTVDAGDYSSTLTLSLFE